MTPSEWRTRITLSQTNIISVPALQVQSSLLLFAFIISINLSKTVSAVIKVTSSGDESMLIPSTDDFPGFWISVRYKPACFTVMYSTQRCWQHKNSNKKAMAVHKLEHLQVLPASSLFYHELTFIHDSFSVHSVVKPEIVISTFFQAHQWGTSGLRRICGKLKVSALHI